MKSISKPDDDTDLDEIADLLRADNRYTKSLQLKAEDFTPR